MNPRGCFRLAALCLVLGVAIFCLSGCQASNPQARAQKNPGMLESLPPADQELVMKRTISEGMSKDAVYLAWGKPDSVITGSDRGRETETWRYASLQPIYPYPYAGWGLGLGLGYGRGYYRRGYVAPYASYSLTPDYVPMTSAVVRFRNGRVIAWETADRPPR